MCALTVKKRHSVESYWSNWCFNSSCWKPSIADVNNEATMKAMPMPIKKLEPSADSSDSAMMLTRACIVTMIRPMEMTTAANNLLFEYWRPNMKKPMMRLAINEH